MPGNSPEGKTSVELWGVKLEQEELKNQLRAQLNAEQAEIAFDAVRKKLLEMEAQQSKEDIANLQRQVLEEHKVDIKLENNN